MESSLLLLLLKGAWHQTQYPLLDLTFLVNSIVTQVVDMGFLRSFSLLCTLVFTNWSPNTSAATVSLPSYPLAVKSPYLSTWLPGNQVSNVATAQPEFWAGQDLSWPILARVNGVAYTLFGAPKGVSGSTAAKTVGISYTSSHTLIQVTAGGASFTLDFFSPIFPGTSDYAVQSLPYSYLTVSATSASSSKASVQILSGIDQTWTAQGGASSLNFTTTGTTGFFWFYNPNQIPFTENSDMATYGSVLFGSTTGAAVTYGCDIATNIYQSFTSSGTLPGNQSTSITCANANLAAIAKDLGSVGSTSASVTFAVGFNRDLAINYLGTTQTGYHRSKWPTVQSAIQYFLGNYASALKSSNALDAAVRSKAQAVSSSFGSEYADILEASVRQSFGSIELTVPTNNLAASPSVFLKEISSDGNVNTVDLIYQSWPIFISLNPAYIKMQFQPILSYLALPKSQGWPQSYVIHDIGSHYPNATGHNDGVAEQLPLFETSTLFILLYAYQKYTGDTSFAKQYSSILPGYADYLATNSLYPASQLVSVDAIPGTPNQTALAVQSVIGLKAASIITGNTTYATIASSFVNTIYKLGLGLDGSTPAKSTHFTYNYGQPFSWNVLFASYSDVLLGLNTFPAAAWQMQSKWYLSQIQQEGLPFAGPLNDTNYIGAPLEWGLTDWNVVAAAASSTDVQEAVVNTTHAFMTNGLNTIPFGTKYNVEGPQAYASGNALVIFGGPTQLIQTIYHEQVLDLDAVAIDERTGKIVVSALQHVFIYRPSELENDLRWSLHSDFTEDLEQPASLTVSWGDAEELLLGASSLTLYDTTSEDAPIWRHNLSSPATAALFSPDSDLIASISRYDRLVKIWKRRSYGSEDVRFDFSYLPHPATVTSIEWRKPIKDTAHSINVLYSVCEDRKLRIWTESDPRAIHFMQLWAQIDLQASIQPRDLDHAELYTDRFLFVISPQDFTQTVSYAAQQKQGLSSNKHMLEHLEEVSQHSPDVVVILDGTGHMSAWALVDVGGKTGADNNVFNIAHTEYFHSFDFSDNLNSDREVQLFCFPSLQDPSALCLISHLHHQSIEWLEALVPTFFEPDVNEPPLMRRGDWTGHDKEIAGLATDSSRTILASWTSDECILQRHPAGSAEAGQEGICTLTSSSPIDDVLILSATHAITLATNEISLWNISDSTAKRLATSEVDEDGFTFLIRALNGESSPYRTLVAALSSNLSGVVWQAVVPTGDLDGHQDNKVEEAKLIRVCNVDSELCNGSLPHDQNLILQASGNAHDDIGEITMLSSDGVVSLRRITVNEGDSARILTSDSLESDWKSPAILAASPAGYVALVDTTRKILSIWNRFTELREFESSSTTEEIQTLQWLETPSGYPVLAVVFLQRILVFSTTRMHREPRGITWIMIREIDTRQVTTYPAGSLAWLHDGSLAVSIGLQLLTYDSKFSLTDEAKVVVPSDYALGIAVELFEIVALLNSSLPLYHPHVLSHCIQHDKAAAVAKIVITLQRRLRFFSDGDELESLLGLPIMTIVRGQKNIDHNTRKASIMNGDISQNGINQEEEELLSVEMSTNLIENLDEVALPCLLQYEQKRLRDVINYFAQDYKQHKSLDSHAIKYAFAFRQHMDYIRSQQDKLQPIPWKDIIWATHSNSQDVLLDLVSRHFQGKLLWQNARQSGMFMWISDPDALRSQFEIVARNEYTKTDEKNPIDCSLHYLALKRKAVLLGLWRMAAWNREQSSTQRFLSNNFSDSRWKTAALKNAYALMGKRRFEYAAAFFLLADNLRDAVSVCANQMQDLQLAIAIARVYVGNDADNPVLKDLINDKVIPQAAREGNRWMASWAYWMLGTKDKALQSLTVSPHALLMGDTPPTAASRDWTNVEPSLVVLYRYLRDRMSTREVLDAVTQKQEWDFVLQMAILYDRMGCGLLALDLVRNWKFMDWREIKRNAGSTKMANAAMQDAKEKDSEKEVTKTERAEEIPPTAITAMEIRPKKAAPTNFEEPSANSLLDSFGF
ncbi:regulator of (H+)-ATPase in vacuolar membrane [Agyrium rufum]|nr:regulator of (H+)-ATPase in vacuolar membrane [Agyrium rufum]